MTLAENVGIRIADRPIPIGPQPLAIEDNFWLILLRAQCVKTEWLELSLSISYGDQIPRLRMFDKVVNYDFEAS